MALASSLKSRTGISVLAVACLALSVYVFFRYGHVAGQTPVERLSKVMLRVDNSKTLGLELGIKLVHSGQLGAAKRIFEDVLAKEPTNVSVLNNLAYVAGEQGDLKLAGEYLQTVLQISAACGECLNNLGSVRHRQGNAEEARRLFEQAARVEPTLPDAKLNLAVLAEEKSEWVEALQWYKQAEPLVKDSEIKKQVLQRMQWMTEITQSSHRQIAGAK